MELARKIRIETLRVALSNLNFPRFFPPAYFTFKANFQLNQVAIPVFLGILPDFQGTIPGFHGTIPGFQGAIPVFQKDAGNLNLAKAEFLFNFTS